jgi:hypothetical protein
MIVAVGAAFLLSYFYPLASARRRNPQTSVTITAATNHIPSKVVPTGSVTRPRKPNIIATRTGPATSTSMNWHGSIPEIGLLELSMIEAAAASHTDTVGPKVNTRIRPSGTPNQAKG